jgi:selenocysteine lyase/cysteine desulfurase
MFDKSAHLFPVKKTYAYLSHCSISPLYGKAAEQGAAVLTAQSEQGILGNLEYKGVLEELRSHLSRILHTEPDNVSFVKNTSEGMGMIANGYPFQPGDEVISYIHEYPANHYPWKLQEGRGVRLRLLPNRDVCGGTTQGRPCGWSIEDLKEALSPKTKLVALSHVQFSSGFAADLYEVGALCRERGIDLVVDAAQSLGCLPISPEEWNISAVVSSGWKWLLGPVGTGVMYTSPAFRKRLGHVLTGAELMCQDTDYLNHAWDPHACSRRFEYSTSHVSLAAALEVCLREVQAHYTVPAIRDETFRLQDLLRQGLDPERYTAVAYPEKHRSGILSVICRRREPEEVQQLLAEKGVIASARSGYLRLAPYFYNTESEIERALAALHAL